MGIIYHFWRAPSHSCHYYLLRVLKKTDKELRSTTTERLYDLHPNTLAAASLVRSIRVVSLVQRIVDFDQQSNQRLYWSNKCKMPGKFYILEYFFRICIDHAHYRKFSISRRPINRLIIGQFETPLRGMGEKEKGECADGNLQRFRRMHRTEKSSSFFHWLIAKVYLCCWYLI